MVMVSSGTHLAKNHESLSQKRIPKLKMLGPLCNQQLTQRQTSNILLQFTELKYSPSVYLKPKKKLK